MAAFRGAPLRFPVNSLAWLFHHSAGVIAFVRASAGDLRGITATVFMLIGSITRMSLAVLA
jgi:hypothetical protein